MSAGMGNIFMQDVGSAVTFQPVIGNSIASGNTFTEQIKNSSTSDLVRSYQLQMEGARKKLTSALEKLKQTERAALRQEIREIEAVLKKGDFTVKISDLPNVRWFGQKWKNELVREAKVEIKTYNDTWVWVHSLTKSELLTRGIDLTNLTTYTASETATQELEELVSRLGAQSQTDSPVENSVLDGLNGEIRAIETATGINRAVLLIGIFVIILYLKKRKKRSR